ncbi:MAG: hypothetical protein KDE54_24440 [Caldilineaceae bacterium]|nr:hypothetical protein [Caldilineaceae bacterium]
MAISFMLEKDDLPEHGSVELRVRRAFDLNVSAAEAQRQVDRWLIETVSYMMGAGAPILLVTDAQVAWQAPVIFTLPPIGSAGVIGHALVDVETAALVEPVALKAELLRTARALHSRVVSAMPERTMPAAEFATDLCPTVTAPQGDPREILAAHASLS